VEEITRPAVGLTRAELTAVTLDKQAHESPGHVVIDVPKLDDSIPGAKVRAPAAEHRGQLREGLAQVPMTHGAGRERLHALLYPVHGALRRPSLQVVHPSVYLLPQRPAHARAQVTAEKVEPLATMREVDLSRFLRVQLQPEPREHCSHVLLGLLARGLRVAHDHESSA